MALIFLARIVFHLRKKDEVEAKLSSLRICRLARPYRNVSVCRYTAPPLSCVLSLSKNIKGILLSAYQKILLKISFDRMIISLWNRGEIPSIPNNKLTNSHLLEHFSVSLMLCSFANRHFPAWNQAVCLFRLIPYLKLSEKQ